MRSYNLHSEKTNVEGRTASGLHHTVCPAADKIQSGAVCSVCLMGGWPRSRDLTSSVLSPNSLRGLETSHALEALCSLLFGYLSPSTRPCSTHQSRVKDEGAELFHCGPLNLPVPFLSNREPFVYSALRLLIHQTFLVHRLFYRPVLSTNDTDIKISASQGVGMVREAHGRFDSLRMESI